MSRTIRNKNIPFGFNVRDGGQVYFGDLYYYGRVFSKDFPDTVDFPRFRKRYRKTEVKSYRKTHQRQYRSKVKGFMIREDWDNIPMNTRTEGRLTH